MEIGQPEVWSDILKNADLVALGEPIHGSGLNAMAFVSLIRSAFTQQGYRILNIELPWAEMESLDEKLQSGAPLSNDEIKAKTGSLYSYFLQEFLKWMQQQNQTLPIDKRYHVAGFDTQQVVTDFERLRTAWTTLQIGSAESFDAAVGTCHGATGFASQVEFNAKGGDRKRLTKQEGDACRATLGDLRSRFEKGRAPVRLSDWFLVDLALRSRFSEILKWEGGISVESVASRDVSMADAFETLSHSRFPGQKQILWGHRWHMMKNTKKLRLLNMPPSSSFMNEADSMGSLLARKYGTRYKTIGTIATSYTIQVKGLHSFTIEDPLLNKSGTLSEFLFRQRRFFMLGNVTSLVANSDTQNYFLTRQVVVQGPNAGQTIDMKDVIPGAVSAFEVPSLKEHFDGILYLFHAL